MDLSIIIVSWNVKDNLRDNLRALFKSMGDFKFEVFVVDNDSKDGTAEMIRNEFTQVNIIVNKENLGFAKANNQAIKLAQGRYILLLNPDMRVLSDTLSKMIDWMDKNSKASIAGCHLKNENGETVPHVRRFPTVWDQLAIILKIPHIFPFVLNRYLMKNFDYTQEAEVDSIRGSFFIASRSAVDKLGGLDERYFIWFEEVDYCRQIKKDGLKIFYTPSAECIDYVGQSFNQVDSLKKQRYFRDSMLKYFQKWHPAWQYWLLLLVWPIGMFMVWAGNKVKRRGIKIKLQ